jgi:hypothetical protein
MFELTLLDHLRLTFGHVVFRHKAHAHIAGSRARWSKRLRVAEAVLLLAVAAAAFAAASGRSHVFDIISASLACLALATLLIHFSVDFDGTARVHAECASRLWQLRERYRALLSDLSDRAIDLEAARRGRDVLMDELHAIYAEAPAEDYQAYQLAAKTVRTEGEGGDAYDEEIDAVLVKSLQARFS